jgi:hypothetical protein
MAFEKRVDLLFGHPRFDIVGIMKFEAHIGAGSRIMIEASSRDLRLKEALSVR